MGNLILDESRQFAVTVIKVCRELPKDAAGFAISDQLIRSATSIGANANEGQDAMSKADFIKCMNVALKEARESKYWIEVSMDTGLIPKNNADEMLDKCRKIIAILTKIVKSTRLNTYGTKD